jgi:hypothetical protein
MSQLYFLLREFWCSYAALQARSGWKVGTELRTVRTLLKNFFDMSSSPSKTSIDCTAWRGPARQ